MEGKRRSLQISFSHLRPDFPNQGKGKAGKRLLKLTSSPRTNQPQEGWDSSAPFGLPP